MAEGGRTYPMAEAVRAAYRAGEEDEAMEPRVLVDGAGAPVGRIADGDRCLFYDIRGEREIELTAAFTDPSFGHFPTAPIRTRWTTMIRYDADLDADVAFPPQGTIAGTLGETVARAGLKQARIAESEKAVHATFFLSGKRGEPFEGEDRVIVESPGDDEVGHDAHPEMASAEVAAEAVRVVEAGAHDLVFVNLANCDVCGHIPNREAVLAAVHAVDAAAGRIVEAARAGGAAVLITADHGSVERWYYPEGAIDTGHTDRPVPFVLVDEAVRGKAGVLREGGDLTDVAPTALALLGLEPPAAMTGRSLLAAGALPGGRRRIVLLLLDGWGAGAKDEKDLIHLAETPVMDALREAYPSTTLAAAGPPVGMPEGTVGNSECGHLHLGAGRIVPSDRVRIERAIADGSFRTNPAFLRAMDGAKESGAALHLVGIISFYSSHGSVEHLLELMRMAHERGVPRVFIHGMLGRRGERPESGAVYTERVEAECASLGTGRMVDIIGRFWSLDREGNWDRIEKTYRMLVDGRGVPVPDTAV